MRDMINTYKILTNKVGHNTVPFLPQSSNIGLNTCGHSIKLSTERCRYDIRKYSFCSRIVSVWNSLPDDVISYTSVHVGVGQIRAFLVCSSTQKCSYK